MFVKIGSPQASLKVFVLGIDNITRDGLASIVRMKLVRLLTNHDLVERQECWLYKHDLEPNFELESSKEQQEAKWWKDVNTDIRKMAKPSNFHNKDNTTLEDVMSFLETLKELFGEDYKEAKQIKIATTML